MLLGPGVLAGLTVLFGIWPGAVNGLMTQASSVVLGEPVAVKLALWHGITTPLILSLVAIGLGVAVFWGYGFAAAAANRLLRPSFNFFYDLALANLLQGSTTLTRFWQNGRLRYYLATILMSATGLVGYAILFRASDLINWSDIIFIDPTIYEIILGLIIIMAAFRITRATGRLEAIAGLGVIGALVSLFFVLFSAPDLALTQLLIETLMVIVFLLVFHFLPTFFKEHTTKKEHGRDFLISGLVGLVAFGLVLLSTAITLPHTDLSLSEYFTTNSYPLAHGRNIVNVILVDFRGVDTLGEITVLAIAAIGIFALLRSKDS
jgi:multicomponent Na+:H+ antiporter subunit A